MIKKFKLFILITILFFSCIFTAGAYTKEDVINLTSSINVCSSESASLVNGMKTTYVRLLNERDVSTSDLNKIYNNISYVKNILSSYNVCSKEGLSALPKSVKDKLYNLYNETNKIITSSPKHVDKKEESNLGNNNSGNNNSNNNSGNNNSSNNTSSDSSNNNSNNNNSNNNNSSNNNSNSGGKKSDGEIKVVVDSSTNEIKIYEDGTLIDVVGGNTKLNYVGLNKIIIFSIILMVIVLIIMIVLKIFKKKNIFITSTIYSVLILLSLTLIFRNEVSIALDTLYTMSVKLNNAEKELVVYNNKIISYPSYESKYATIYINDNSEDVYFGDSSYILSKGIGHTTQTSLPGEGSTTVLSGHNTGLFKELFNLNKKDKVVIETTYGKFTYEMSGSKVVDDTDLSSISEEYDLILYTCYPNSTLYGNKRLVVYLNLIDSEWLGEASEE